MASLKSLGMMVTLLPWMAHRFASSRSIVRYTSLASCSAIRDEAVNLQSGIDAPQILIAISLTRREKGNFGISKLVDL